jgi:hypothetical protein
VSRCGRRVGADCAGEATTQAVRRAALVTLVWNRAVAAVGRAARRRAGGASVHAMAYGSWRCGQVLSGARAEGAGGARVARLGQE